MRLLLLLIAAIVVYRFIKGLARSSVGHRRPQTGETPAQIDDVMVQDPYCGVYFPRRDGVALSHEGRELLFCSEACRQAYLKRSAGK